MKEEAFKESSELRFYSVGVVFKGNSTISASTGNVSSNNQITVSPIETMNAQKQGPIEEFNTVTAEWLAISQPNRVSAPNVYPNQSVMLYKYANTEQYFWVTMRNEADLQKAETVIYAFSNIPQDKGWENDTTPVSMNSSNSYFISIGGSGIFITTPNNREEVTKYKISVDCKKGKISILDDFNNTIALDSKKGTLLADTKNRIHLKTGALLTLEAKDVSVKGTLYTDANINCGGEIKTGGGIYTAGDINCSGTVKYSGLQAGAESADPDTPPTEASIDRASGSDSFSGGAVGVGDLLGGGGAVTSTSTAGGSGSGRSSAKSEKGITGLGMETAVAAAASVTPSNPASINANTGFGRGDYVTITSGYYNELGVYTTVQGTFNTITEKASIDLLSSASISVPGFRELAATLGAPGGGNNESQTPSMVQELLRSF